MSSIFPSNDGIAQKLSAAQKEYLVDHLDGKRAIANRDAHEIRTRGALIARKLIQHKETITSRPTATVLTDKGRDALCAILGEYAEQLMRAQEVFLKRPVHPKAATSVERETLLRNLMSLRNYDEQPKLTGNAYGRFIVSATRPQDGGRFAFDDADQSG
jgi:hypothetical protein